jgi:hypothetical protein
MAKASRSRPPVLLPTFFSLTMLVTLVAASGAPPAEGVPTAFAGGDSGHVEDPCPGQQTSSVLATGTYRSVPVPEAVINGAPWGGAYWAPGERSYWHCHAGGQHMMVWEGTGRVQRRGERIQTLSVGESHYVRPGEEHWHGAAPHQHAHYLQVTFLPAGTFWMEEVGQEDYLGNGIGMTTREAYLRTGVRESAR